MAVRATKEQVKAFLHSILWKDMVREAMDWRKAARQDYDIATDLLTLGRIQGRLEAIDYMIGLPEGLLQIIEDQIEEKKLEDLQNDSRCK
jgi:hypothetical protein